MARGKGICIFMILILFLTPHNQTLNDSVRDVSETEGRQGPQTNFTQLDQNIQNLVTRWNLPGAQAAVVYNGTLVFEQSYGMADTALQIPVENESRFRIASLSKAITAAAIHTLVVSGDISLRDNLTDHISHLMPNNLRGCAYPNHANGWSIENITIRHLLNHISGLGGTTGLSTTSWHYEYHWVDNDTSWEGQNNPCIDHVSVAEEYDNGTLAPVKIETTIRETLRLPLDNQPGTTYQYSNLGYRILGEIIESASGMGYEEYVKQYVFGPMGISDTQTGKTLPLQKTANEVTYYSRTNDTWYSYFPLAGSTVEMNSFNVSFGNNTSTPDPYGGERVVEEMEASGGWISTAASYARFISHLDGTLNHTGFNNSFNYFTNGQLATPSTTTAAGRGIFYTINNNQSWVHSGAISGTATRFVRNLVGGVPVTIVLLANTNIPSSETVGGLSWASDRNQVLGSVFTTVNFTGLECILGDTKQESKIGCSCIPLEEIWHCPPPEETEWPQYDPNLNTDPALNTPPEENTTEYDDTVVPSIGLVAMLSIIGLVAIIRRGRIEI